MTGLLTQHALRALNVRISSADSEAECALGSYRPITNWCVLADLLSGESVKDLFSGMEWRLVCRFKGYYCS